MTQGNFKSQVERCNNLQELVNLLNQCVDDNGRPMPLTSGGKQADSHQVRDLILKFINGEGHYLSITRNYGLRYKVLELIEKDTLEDGGTMI